MHLSYFKSNMLEQFFVTALISYVGPASLCSLEKILFSQDPLPSYHPVGHPTLPFTPPCPPPNQALDPNPPGPAFPVCQPAQPSNPARACLPAHSLQPLALKTLRDPNAVVVLLRKLWVWWNSMFNYSKTSLSSWESCVCGGIQCSNSTEPSQIGTITNILCTPSNIRLNSFKILHKPLQYPKYPLQYAICPHSSLISLVTVPP